MYKQISPTEFKEKFMKNPQKLEIIDVRTPEVRGDMTAGYKLFSLK